MAARLSASPLISYAALIPLLSRRAATVRYPFPFSGRSLLSFSSKTLTVARDATAMDVSARARRGFASQVDDFASPDDLCFEAPLKIVEYPDPILRARNKRISTFDDNLKKLAKEMFDVMYKTDGIGLSAPQVGVNVQLMRPASIKIDARNITGARFRVTLSGLPARIFQHEFDHLQGILFFDRMTEDVLESIRSELKALEQKYESRTGLPSPESIDKYDRTQRRNEIAGFAGR
ncbi:Polypeptide deformylase [Musa troglodytarum]|nr:Polypeptide deformylase [Musa troglodytarum]